MSLNLYLKKSFCGSTKSGKAKWLTGLVAVFLVFVCQHSFGQFSVTATSGTLGPTSYTSLTVAGGVFTAINAGTHKGIITISVTGNSGSETGATALNASGSGSASYNSISIKPSGGAGRTISGTSASFLIEFNGGSNITIDGLNTGGNSLTISNTNTGSGASTIKFLNAPSNTIQNCTILGSNTTTPSSGTINLSATTVGCSNEIIQNNTIGAAGSNLPYCAIFSLGTTNQDNSGTIYNNNIQDYFHPAGTSWGIYLSSNNGAWTIKQNNLFQSGTRTCVSSTNTMYHIYMPIAAGPASTTYVVRGNIIGYAASDHSGTTTYTGTFSNIYCGIYSSLISTCTAQIDSNIIAGTSLVTTNTSTNPGPFCGIQIAAGIANVGTIIGNQIGSSAANGSLNLAWGLATNAMSITGIYAAPAQAVTISNNIIQNINTANSLAGGVTFNGIWIVSGAAASTVSNNDIGGGLANSIVLGINGTTTQGVAVNGINYGNNSATGSITGNNIDTIYANGATTTSNLVGILMSATTTGSTVSNNTINYLNLSANYQGAYLFGIYYSVSSTTISATFSGNTIENLICNNNYDNVSPLQLDIAGIVINPGVVNNVITISQNTIYNLINTYNTASTLACNIDGIYLTSVGSGSTISGNLIYSISADNSNTNAVLTGIYIKGSPAVTVSNNIIQMGLASGSSITGPMLIYGIQQTSTTAVDQFYFNSIYVGGSNVGTSVTNNTYAFFDASTQATARATQDNIFDNERTSSSAAGGNHYAIRINSTTSLTIDDNDYWVAGGNQNNVLGNFNGANKTALSDWKGATGQDVSSISSAPGFSSPATSLPYLNFTTATHPCASQTNVVAPASITVDYYGSTRANYTPVDWGAVAWESVSNPTMSASGPSYNTINLSATANANSNAIVVVYNTTGSFTAPVNGTTLPAVGNSFAGGTVYYKGTAGSLTSPHTGLTPNTTYYYDAFSYDNSYNWSTGATTSATTLNCTPSAYNVTGTGHYCSGGSGLAIGLDNSQTGVSYQLYRNGGATSVGSPVSGTGSAITFGNKTVADTYTVVATNTNSGCSNLTANMTGSATITIDATSVGGTATATAPTICTGTNTSVSVSGYTGSIAWLQSSTSGGSYSGVTGGSGAGTASYTTPNLTTTTYYKAQVTNGTCASDYSTVASVTVQNYTTTPTITTSPIVANTTTVSGTSEAGASITIYKGGSTSLGTATADGSGNWTSTNISPAFVNGDVITATASVSGECSSTSAGSTVINAAPSTITVSGTLTDVSTTYGTASSTPTSFTVSGDNMIAGILITPPAGFEVSQTAGGTSGYASTQTVGSTGTIATTTIYVRLAATTAVGTYSGNITCTSTNSNNPTIATASSTVSAALLTVTALNQTVTYGDAPPTYTYNITGYVNGENVSVLNGTTPSITSTYSSTTPVSASPVAITAAAGTLAAANYSFTYVSAQVTINTKGLTVTGLTANNKPYDGNTTATLSGTAALSGVINSDDVSLSGTPSANFVTSNAGNGITVNVTGYTLSGTKTSNYNLTQPMLSANITAIGQTITFNSLPTKTYGSADFSPGATASSGLTVTYASSNTNVATIVSGNIHIVAAGTCNITASQAGNGNYNAASNVVQQLTINTASLTITANNVVKIVGATLSSPVSNSNFTTNGLVLSETVGTVTITYGTGAASGAAIGTYVGSVVPSAATGGTFTASNYSITYVAGNILVTPPTKYWRSATAGGAWTTGSNWSTVGLGGASCSCTPVANDSVVFGNTSAISVTSVPQTVGGSELVLEGMSNGSASVTLSSSFGVLHIVNVAIGDGDLVLSGSTYFDATTTLNLNGNGNFNAASGSMPSTTSCNININGSGAVTLPSGLSSLTMNGTLTLAGSGNFNMGTSTLVLQLTGLNLSGTGNVRATSNSSNTVIQIYGAITETGSGMIDLSFGSTSDNRIEFIGSSCTNSGNLQLQTRNGYTNVYFEGVGTAANPFPTPVFPNAYSNEALSYNFSNNCYVTLSSDIYSDANGYKEFGKAGSQQAQKVQVDLGSTLDCGTHVIQGPAGNISCNFPGAPYCPDNFINGTVKTAAPGGLYTNFTWGVTLGSASTVEYNAAGTQTVDNLSFFNLALSGSGAKTISTSASTSLCSGVLFITGSATASVANPNVSVGRLWLGGVPQTLGTYGSTSSVAANKNNTYFTSGVTGYVNVLSSGTTAVFSGLTPSQIICPGTASVTLSGTISGTYDGDSVNITLNGVTQQVRTSGSAFSVTFTTSSLPAGVYTITYSYAGASLNPATDASTTLTVAAPPTAVLSGTATICNGSSTNLTVNITGGKSPYTVVINNGVGTISNYTSGTNISVSPSSTTTYSLTSVTDACGLVSTAMSGTPTVTVNALPATPGAITGNSPQCAGTGVTFTQGSCSAGTCYWVSSATGTETSNSNSTFTTATTAGTYTVWVRALNNGCWSSAAATTSGIVNALPATPGTITSNSPQCSGTGIIFTKGSCSQGTCYWVSSATGTETTNSASTFTSSTAPGTYNVWVRALNNGCWSSAAATASGTVNDLPSQPGAISSNSPQCTGTGVTFTQGSCTSGSTCYWVSSATGVETTNSNSTFTSGTSSGTYTVYVRAKDNTTGCWSTASSISGTVHICPVVFTVKLYIQGYYIGGGKLSPLLKLLNVSGSMATDVDTVTINFYSDPSGSPDYSFKGVLQSDGTISCSFPQGTAASYYIEVKHRNSLTTWSNGAKPVSAASTSYDFTTGVSQAYGSNMTSLGDGSYGIYSGDITDGTTAGVRDGHINSSDYSELQSVLPSFTVGVYDIHDLNGDGMVDEDDYRILKNNAALSLSVSHP